MDPRHTEICKTDSNCEIRTGKSSWDPNEDSIKYTWFTSAGKPARGGEVPIKALPQMLQMAIQLGLIQIA
jgi:hypothetical protein